MSCQAYHAISQVPKSSIAMITLFYLVLHWNEFFRAMIYLNDPNKWPLQVVLRQFVVDGDKVGMVGLANVSSYTEVSQVSIRALKAGMISLTIAPLVLIYPFILKFFYQGHNVRRGQRMNITRKYTAKLNGGSTRC